VRPVFFAPVDAGGTPHKTETFAVCAAFHIIVEIVAARVNGSHGIAVQLNDVRFIGIHGIKCVIVIGIGKVYPAVRFAEKAAVIQVSGGIADCVRVIHRDFAGQYCDRKQCGQYEDDGADDNDILFGGCHRKYSSLLNSYFKYSIVSNPLDSKRVLL
jgi:hypothetical protein